MKKSNIKDKRILIIMLVLLIAAASACKKFVTVPLPGTEVYPSDIFSSDVTARAAMLGIYGEMIGTKGFASGYTGSVTFLSALSADELTSYSAVTAMREFYDNAITAQNSYIEKSLWGEAYKCIYSTNALLKGLEQASHVSTKAKNQLTGEGLFTRAFCYFYLANLFGDVPYVQNTDYRSNITLPRLSSKEVYQKIIQDLKNAMEKLDTGYTSNTSDKHERIRPNKWAATALLARVLLYNHDWAGAETEAGKVIACTDTYQLEDSLNQVFLSKSREAIWQLKPNTSGINTWEGNNFILTSAPSSGESSSACLSQHLSAAFEKGDLRGSIWIDSVVISVNKVYFYPYKYKVKNGGELTEYNMVLRLAEQYLIRAEARVQLGNITGAIEDLNMIRRRAGLQNYSGSTDKTSLQTAILHERQVELFTEWGHRWLDLKRTQQANKILKTVKPSQWQDFDTLYPIPHNERLLNQQLTQNPGYN